MVNPSEQTTDRHRDASFLQHRAHLHTIAAVQQAVSKSDPFRRLERLHFRTCQGSDGIVGQIAGWNAKCVAFGEDPIAVVAEAVAEDDRLGHHPRRAKPIRHCQ